MSNLDKALGLARGSHQKDLIKGYATLGGSTLKGKAANYRGQYVKSGINLIDRLKAAGIPYNVKLGPRGGWYGAVLVIEESDSSDNPDYSVFDTANGYAPYAPFTDEQSSSDDELKSFLADCNDPDAAFDWVKGWVS